MAYTVKQVATMSGVSVRTLHFYDETGLLKPARYGANGYRFYEEAQLLILQQILFQLGGPGGEPIDCKVSAQDTNGAMCVFEFNCGSGGPRHLHYEQDEWIYII